MSGHQKQSWELLAVVRFALAGIVLVTHMESVAGVGRFSAAVMNFGAFTAVLSFLILSGYSIAHSFARQPDGYYRRRMLRIYPLYAMAILFSLGLCLETHFRDPVWTLKAAAGNLLFLQTYRYAAMPMNAVVWTLAVEATFYLLTPLLARLRTVHLLGIAGVSAAAFFAYPRFSQCYYAGLFHGQATFLLGWAWLAGFIYYRHRDLPVSRFALLAAVIGFCNVNGLYVTRYSELTLIGVCLAICYGGELQLSAGIKKVFGFLGDWSYPLYLFHYPAYLIMEKMHHGQTVPLCFAAAAIVSLTAMGVDHLLKNPLKLAWVWGERQATAVAMSGLQLAEGARGLAATAAAAVAATGSALVAGLFPVPVRIPVRVDGRRRVG